MRSQKLFSQKLFSVHRNLIFKLLKHAKSKGLNSLNFLQRHGKYQIGSCPQLLYALENNFIKNQENIGY